MLKAEMREFGIRHKNLNSHVNSSSDLKKTTVTVFTRFVDSLSPL